MTRRAFITSLSSFGSYGLSHPQPRTVDVKETAPLGSDDDIADDDTSATTISVHG